MENDIALMTTGYLLTRLGLLALIGYAFYRVLRRQPAPVKVSDQSRYAIDRLQTSRRDR